MTCDESRRLITLYRPGERTPSESSALETHLQSCADCRQTSKEFSSSLEHAMQLLAAEPVFPDQDAFTRSVVSAVAGYSRTTQPTWLDRILLPARRPAFRFALLAVVFIPLATLGVQTFETLAGARQIEHRFALQASGQARASVEYDVDLSHVRVPAKDEQTLRSAGLLPTADSRVTVTRNMVRMVEALFDRPAIQIDAANLSWESLDYPTLLKTLQQSVRIRLVVSHGE